MAIEIIGAHPLLFESEVFMRTINRIHNDCAFWLYYGVRRGKNWLIDKLSDEMDRGGKQYAKINIEYAYRNENGFAACLEITRRKDAHHLMAPILSGGVQVDAVGSSHYDLAYQIFDKGKYKVSFRKEELLVRYLERLHFDRMCRKLLGMPNAEPDEPRPTMPWDLN